MWHHFGYPRDEVADMDQRAIETEKTPPQTPEAPVGCLCSCGANHCAPTATCDVPCPAHLPPVPPDRAVDKPYDVRADLAVAAAALARIAASFGGTPNTAVYFFGFESPAHGHAAGVTLAAIPGGYADRHVFVPSNTPGGSPRAFISGRFRVNAVEFNGQYEEEPTPEELAAYHAAQVVQP